MKLLEILLLVLPVTAWALWNDRNGDEHKNYNDVVWETFFIVAASCIVTIIEFGHPMTIASSLFFLKCVSVSFTGFCLIFPYAFNWMWYNKTLGYHKFKYSVKFNFVLTHLSQTAMPDKWFIKCNVHYLVRLALYVVLFGLSVYWFI